LHSRKLLLSPRFGVWDGHVVPPLNTLTWADEPSALVRLSHRETKNHSAIYVFSADGRSFDSLTEEDRILYTVFGDKVIIFNKNQRLQIWKSGTDRVDVAKVDGKLPPMQDIKGMTVSESLITLVLYNERFILLQRRRI
jgi:hypothetical protein